jgi:hypothetical protein
MTRTYPARIIPCRPVPPAAGRRPLFGHHVLSRIAGEKRLALREQGTARVRAEPRIEVRDRVEAEDHHIVVLDPRNGRDDLERHETGEGPALIVDLRLPVQVVCLAAWSHALSDDHGRGDRPGGRCC